MKYRKITGFVLVLALLAASLFGCAASGAPDETTRSTGGTAAAAPERPDTTGPAAEPTGESSLPDFPISTLEPTGGFTVALAGVSQHRLQNMSAGWQDAFNGENGCFLVVDSANGLTDALSRRGRLNEKLDLSGYDDAFFRDNRLVVIPRCSGSGSVRYEAVLAVEASAVRITLQGVLDGDGTDVMTDWLVFVALPLADYPAEQTVVVTGSAGGSGSTEVS